MSEDSEHDRRLLSAGYRRLFVFLMFFVCLFDFADRAVFNVTQDAIKAEFGLSDFEIGILGGAAFAALYSIVGVPIGRLAERRNRIRIVAACTALWSLATVWSGLAANYVSLALGRIGVGLGEAGFMGPTSSLVSDLFPSGRRASAMALIVLGTPTGVFIGANIGGWAAEAHDWRLGFLLLGAPGLLVAAAVLIVLREPRRGLVDHAPARPAPHPDMRAFLRHVVTTPALRMVILGGGVAGFGITAISTFLAPYLARAHDLSPGQAGSAYGTISAIGLTFGFIIGAFGADWLSARDRRWSARVPAIGLAAAAPVYWLAFSTQSLALTAILLTVAAACLMSFYGPNIGMIQNLSPPRMRATGTALFTLIYALCGYLLGPPTIGIMSDRFAQSAFAGGDFHAACPGGVAPAGAAPDLAQACSAALAGGLKQALMVAVTIFFVAALCYLRAGRTLQRDFYIPPASGAAPDTVEAAPGAV